MKHSDYLKKKKTRETRKKIISVISAIVVFITTYALVLPAITLDVSKASQEPGIAYEQMQFKATAAAASVTAADSTVEEAQVEEPAAEEPEEEPAEVIEEEPAETPEEEASAVSAEEEEEEEAVEEAPAEPEQEEAPTEEPAETAEPQEEKSEADQNAAESSSESAPAEAETADTDKAADQASVDQSGTDAADKADASVAATTAETAAEFEIPELDALDFDDILTGKTNFYYYHVENAEEAEEISSDSIDDWRKVGSDTVLAPEDFVRVYLAYEIPAGALNETNAVARYTLPAGLELSDKQIEAINKYENGIAASKSGSEQDKYLGAEAIEGSRTPDEKADDEYIAATVKVKKTDNGRQELVFTFIPYTVEKNQISYDERGEVKSKGKEVKGFFTFDLTTSQIDFEETNTETVDKEDGTTEEIQYSEAKVVFADKDNNRIDRTLTLAGPVEKEEAPAAEQKTLTSQGADYTVTVSYTDDAQIPDNAELTVREIEKDTDEYASYLEQAKGAVDNTKSVNEARFFDITILADGEKVEPQAPVNVQITFAGIEQTNTDDTQLLHYKDDEKIEVMDQAEFSKSEEQTVDTVQFETDGFSVYGIVGTEIITDPGLYTFEGDGFTVKINVPEEANIPSGTELTVSEIDPDSDEYAEHLGEAWHEINKEYLEAEQIRYDIPEDVDLSQYNLDAKPVNIDGARFFDIKFMNGEEEIEPDVPVKVEISYDDGFTASEETIAGVAHYAKDGIELIDDVETVVEDGEIVSFKYEQESFSDTGTYVGQETSDEEGIIGNYDVSINYANYDNLLTDTEAKQLRLAAATKDAGTTLKAAGLNAPATDKSLISNDDGSYTLALSVTGAAQSSSSTNVTKSNVVIVMDRSNSMTSGVTSYTPYTGEHQSGTTYYGYYNNQYITLYYNNGIYYRSYSRRTGQYSNPYSGTIYTGRNSNRLDEEQAALDTVVGTLLAQNKNQTTADGTSLADIIEIKVISFATGRGDGSNNSYSASSTESGWSTDKNTLMGYVNNDSTSTGTNWEEAMEYALEVANAKKTAQPNENTYVIFLTDGEPTTHNGSYSVNTNYASELQKAEPDAKAIVDAGHTFYSIFTYGSGTSANYLRRLVNYAYGNGDVTTENDTLTKYFFDATDTSALTSALQSIVQDITNSVGYTNVDLTDGVTEMTSTNLKTSTDGSVTGLKYYRSGGTTTGLDGSTIEKYSSTANNGLGVEWPNAPAATINEDGEVEWDLEDMVLEDGVTYTLTFVVWPSQESVDLVADLNNHKVTYDSLTDAQKSQIMISGNMYVLKTNTDYPTVTYSTITTTTINGETTTTTSDPVTANITNPDPIGLSEARMTVEKKWDDSLDPSQREEVEGSVVLDLTMGNTVYMEGIEISDETDWKIPEAVCVAPGLMVTNDSPAYDPTVTQVTYGGKTYAVLEPGHDYIFSEEDINSHFELTAYSHHPMLVNGTLTYVTFTYDGEGNITGVFDMYEAATLSATNTIKGGINIQKKVVDLDGNEVESGEPFTVTVHLTDADGNALPTKTASDGTPYSYDYRIYYGANNPAGSPVTDEDGNITYGRSDHIYGTGTSFNVTIYPGDVVRVVNIESGALYHVTETLDSSSQYALQSIDYTIAVGTGNATSYDESDVGETVTKDGVTWYSVEGNSASSTVVTNKVPVAEIGLLKIGDGQTSNPLENVTFELYSTYDAENPESNVKAKDSSGNEITTIMTDEDGLAIVGKLLAGTYYLVETSTNDGYNLLATPVTITINKTDTGFTVTYHQDSNSASDAGAITPTDGIYRITVDNKSGAELPMTGGSGTIPYTLSGLALMMAAAMMYGFRMRRRERRSN